MKRPAFALCAGILLLGLLPGSTLAKAPRNILDLSNPMVAGYSLGSGDTLNLAQTFKADKSGMLTEVDLWMGGAGIVDVQIENLSAGLPDGINQASASAPESNTYGWVKFYFPTPFGVTLGTSYAIVFDTTSVGTVFGSPDNYPDGQALIDLSGWKPVTTPNRPDWAFQTFVDTATAKLQWDKSSITAGASTQLTLTGTLTYIYGSEASGYSAVLDSLPSWYDPTTIVVTCDWAPGCTLAGLEKGYIVGDTSGGATLTFTLVGTAKPLAADIGTPGTASGGGCLQYPPPREVNVGVQPNELDPGCADPTASVAVAAAAAPTPTPTPTPTPSPTKAATPPPTNSGAGPASDKSGGVIWFLPFALVASLGGLLVILDQRRRRSI